MFRKFCYALVSLGLLISTPAKAVDLTASTIMMETHPVMATSLIPFFKEWSKRSGGKVNVTYFNPGTLCSSAEMFSACEKGVINLTMAPLGSAPALFPISMFVDMPLIFDNARSATLSGLSLMELPQLKEEYAKWKILSFNASAPRQILSRKPIHKLEDLKGLKISTSSAQGGEMLTALGAIPVTLPLNDTYLALQRGMVDAVALPVPTFRSTKVTEVAKYVTICNLNPSPTPLVMSRASYDALPPKAKEELDKVAGEPLSSLLGSGSDFFAAQDLEWVVKNHKVQIIELDDAELDRWREAVKSTHESWKERATRQGVKNPEALLDALLLAADKYNNLELQQQILANHKEALGVLYPNQTTLNILKK